ncbi:cytochrome c biogenesis CcdA family protein [Terribacillus saccharophilus]|uniref:Cytochrome C biogenesis protein CcdA n=1 Tax=Terribacillus saccharophilus TaxID=361277 RepID=A0ABX4H2U8_9BACI|nr:cytochrome c biogenesis protein CcdA [Terribacillus saccharophilus]PAD37110.1 cytochrome C biogenesis protein CcdA [Terribacillus saccharophilus]PAD97419.1 cytochrome C biogenesis protein CcdA [Terribacillus saccharophilus]PAE01467.1 cytochrome C biogenesis protein CcdA [Terribacillus saccharophilus]
MENIGIFLAFMAGILSFLSPCSLPLYPAFISYIAGVSINDLKTNDVVLRRNVFTHSLLFLIGFSIIFLALGLSTSLIGRFFTDYKDLLRELGAILMVFFGLVLTGILQFDALLTEKRVNFKKKTTGYLGSVLLGIGTAAGWTPCTGPILAGVFALGLSDPGKGLVYMLIYCLGFSIPFIILSFFIERMGFLKRNSRIFMITGGLIMIGVGVLLYFDALVNIVSWLTFLT